MIKEGIHGFCMALADSVPGVSGGTVAFIMGFYDNFIGSIHNVVFGSGRQRRQAIRYLIRLGGGWIVGMVLAVLALTALFDSQIYVVSSLFLELCGMKKRVSGTPAGESSGAWQGLCW